jgi:predicted DCC family thiol-disulfide oxidoreductase YuxK
MAEAMLLYDEDCGFCRWTLSKVLAWDRRRALRPVPLSSAEADRILAGMSPDQRAASWHLLDRDGRLHSAGAAFPSLFGLLPGGRPLAAISASTPRLSERGYRFLADRRSRFGRLVTDGAKRRADRRIGERSRREEG